MTSEDKVTLELEDPKAYESLLENSIKLGLDLQGGMHVAMEVDIEELSRALARNKDDRFEEAWEEDELDPTVYGSLIEKITEMETEIENNY